MEFDITFLTSAGIMLSVFLFIVFRVAVLWRVGFWEDLFYQFVVAQIVVDLLPFVLVQLGISIVIN